MRRIKLPELPEHCTQCGRKLDGRMFDNPYGIWSTPVMVGSTGRWTCTYCHDAEKGAINLPNGCKALEQLELWLAQPGDELQ